MTETAAQIEEARKALREFLRTNFDPLWGRVGLHPMIGGFVKVSRDPETGRVIMEKADDELLAKPTSPSSDKSPGSPSA